MMVLDLVVVVCKSFVALLFGGEFAVEGIVLGAMAFRLNNGHKEKPVGQNRRGKRTIAKEKLYKFIYSRIRVTSHSPNDFLGARLSRVLPNLRKADSDLPSLIHQQLGILLLTQGILPIAISAIRIDRRNPTIGSRPLQTALKVPPPRLQDQVTRLFRFEPHNEIGNIVMGAAIAAQVGNRKI